MILSNVNRILSNSVLTTDCIAYKNLNPFPITLQPVQTADRIGDLRFGSSSEAGNRPVIPLSMVGNLRLGNPPSTVTYVVSLKYQLGAQV